MNREGLAVAPSYYTPPAAQHWALDSAALELAALGYTIIPSVLSDRMRDICRRHRPERPPVTVIRQVCLGLPGRLIEATLGIPILSALNVAPISEWHRVYDATAHAGAPVDFVPGLDIAFSDLVEQLSIELLPGSQRLTWGPQLTLPRAWLKLAPGDVLITDSRLWRRWPEIADANRTVVSSLVRCWMEPAEDFSCLSDQDSPQRLRQFLGATTRPAKTVDEWRHRAHSIGEI